MDRREVQLVNLGRLDWAARLLSIGSEDLTGILMKCLGYVKKDIVNAYLDAKGAGRQRDRLVGGLYTLLFAYIVETGNHKLDPEYAGVDSIYVNCLPQLNRLRHMNMFKRPQPSLQHHKPWKRLVGLNF
jgi:myosin heavy subunit